MAGARATGQKTGIQKHSVLPLVRGLVHGIDPCAVLRSTLSRAARRLDRFLQTAGTVKKTNDEASK
jgi:hypothetical protein